MRMLLLLASLLFTVSLYAGETDTTWRAGDETVERVGCSDEKVLASIMSRPKPLFVRALVWATIDGDCWVFPQPVGIELTEWVSGPYHAETDAPASIWRVRDPALDREFYTWELDGGGAHKKPNTL